MTAGEIKSTAFDFGADLCGIAPVDRFASGSKTEGPSLLSTFSLYPHDYKVEALSILFSGKQENNPC